jgi:hypothetical protein
MPRFIRLSLWHIVILIVFTALLSSCDVLFDSPKSSYAWSSMSTQGFITDFGLYPDSTPYANKAGTGFIRYDASSKTWTQIDTPGSYKVARNSNEYADNGGIYERQAGETEWKLLEGSRQLQLAYLALDRDGSLYAYTSTSGVTTLYVRLKDSTAWTLLNYQPPTSVAFYWHLDALGRVYLDVGVNTIVSYKLQGATVVPLAHHPTHFDFQGNAYIVPSIYADAEPGGGRTISRIKDDGTLEPWVKYGGAGTAPILKLVGFGKDGRFYAVAGLNTNVDSTDDFGQFDLVAISPQKPFWHFVASGVSDETGKGDSGVAYTLDSYNTVFAPDGSLYFHLCLPCGQYNAPFHNIHRLEIR